jgi:hypothetical protein
MGRKQFEQIVAQAPRRIVKKITVTDTTEILVSAFLDVMVYSPAGTISRTNAIDLLYPAIATAISGTHFISVYCANAIHGVIYGSHAYNEEVKYRYGQLYGAPVEKAPNDATALYLAQRDIYFDSENALVVRFWNASNVSDGGSTKKVELWVVEEEVS